MIQKKASLFTSLGLRKEDERIYEFLLGKAPQGISSIAQATGLHRPLIYRHLPPLIASGIVRTVPRAKTKLYTAAAPEHLLALFEEKTETFSAQVKAYRDAYTVEPRKPLVSYTEGAEGIRQTFHDLVETMKRGGVYYRYSSYGALAHTRMGRYHPKSYREKRNQKQLERMIITNAYGLKHEPAEWGKDMKAVPADFNLFEDDIVFSIYGDKISIVDYASETAVTIESSRLARFQEKLFKLLWRRL